MEDIHSNEAQPEELVEFISEDDLTEEQRADLRERVLNSYNEDYSLLSAIKEAEGARVYRVESFNAVKEDYKIASRGVYKSIFWLTFTAMEATLLRIYDSLTNDPRTEVVQQIIDETKKTRNELIDTTYLLRTIKRATRLLKRYKACQCNLQLSELLLYVKQKDKILVQRLYDMIDSNRLAIKGITFVGTDRTQEALEEVNNNLENSVRVLGLYQETPSDK